MHHFTSKVELGNPLYRKIDYKAMIECSMNQTSARLIT